MNCQNCGKKLKPNEKFCTVCGYYNSKEETDNKIEEEIEYNDIELDDEDDDLDSFDFDLENDEVDISENDNSNDIEEEKEEKKEEEFEEFNIDDIPTNNKKEKKEKTKYYEYEYLLDSFIGEDANIIKEKTFNIYAFIFNWLYFIYRKMYITGILGLLVSLLIFIYIRILYLPFIILSMIIIGFTFNKIYVSYAKRMISKIVLKDDDLLEKETCEKKGRVNFIIPLIIYTIYLVIIVVVYLGIRINPDYNQKFFKENSNNDASCISMIKKAYNYSKSTLNVTDINSAVCRKNNKDYTIYLKYTDIIQYYNLKEGILYYQTDTTEIKTLEEKSINNTITNGEQELLNLKKKIEMEYEEIYKSSKNEQKLIKEKKNKTERLDYDYTKEEITR
ncbi:MAG: DUF2628 domain-containing protein [Bacilli bacterium]|nr:DUF2628 domain-containing protein [Bacilli bacterium]